MSAEQSANKVFPHSGCLQVRGGNVEAYNTTFRHNVGVRRSDGRLLVMHDRSQGSRLLNCTHARTHARTQQLNCAGVACVSDPDASFLASSCIFEHNVCEEILGAGAITVDGRGAEGAAPWVTLDRCTFYENSCNVRR